MTLRERYELVREVGRGGFGAVFQARDLKLNRPVALKRLLVDPTAGGQGGENSLALQRFLREAQVIAALNHPNIVQVFDYDREAQGCFIVMEWVNGGSLRDHLNRAGPLELSAALSLVRALCDGLSYAHRRNLVHRDLKPGNILLASEGKRWVPKIVDFGLARAPESGEVSVSGHGLGTPGYMAPEQRRNAKGVNHTADIYSLGKVLYVLVTGEEPLDVDLARVPRGLEGTIARCLKSKPDERYFSVEEFVRDLDAAAGGGGSTAVSVGAAAGAFCPICGLRNRTEETFKCLRCGRDYLCRGHFVKERRCCEDCAAKLQTEEQAKLKEEQRRQAEEHARKEEDARRAAEEEQRRKLKEEESRKREPASATKDRPWQNTLGMKFVPVPGANVLFCVWPTRVRDYREFVTATRRDWSKAGPQLVPDVPAIDVTWQDANAFCAWLSEREHRAGVLFERYHYRLPTDLEWSAAVGLPPEVGATPRERSGRIRDHYPWGAAWPPPSGAGNYSLVHKCFRLVWLYSSGPASISAVGSYTPNQYGIHDLGGNVWEYCADDLGSSDTLKTIRGASWRPCNQQTTLSSHRRGARVVERRDDLGFRCVLQVGP